MLSNYFNEAEETDLEIGDLTPISMEGYSEENIGEYWTYRGKRVEEKLDWINKIQKDKEKYFGSVLHKIDLCVKDFQRKQDMYLETTQQIPMGKYAAILFTVDGYLKPQMLLDALRREMSLSKAILEFFPKKVTAGMKKVESSVLAALKKPTQTEMAEHLIETFRVQDHPVENFDRGLYYPTSRFLKGTVLLKPSIDTTLPRESLQYIGQFSHLKYKENSIRLVKEQAVTHNQFGRFKDNPTIIINGTEINELLQLAEDLVKDAERYISKYGSVETSFKALSTAMGRLCKYAQSATNEQLKDVSVQMSKYADNLLYLHYTPAMERVKFNVVLATVIVDIVRRVVAIR